MYQSPFNRAPFTALLQAIARGAAKELDTTDALDVTVEQDQRMKLDTGAKIVADFDRDFIAGKLEMIEAMRLEGAGAISEAIGRFQIFGKSPDPPPVDCVVMVKTYRAAYEKILLFNIRSAQILCAMEEIRSSIRFIHECASDPQVPKSFQPPETWHGDVPEVATMPLPGAPVGQPPSSGEKAEFRRQSLDDPINWINRFDTRAAAQEDQLSELERRTTATETASSAGVEALERLREHEAALQRMEERVREAARDTDAKLRAFGDELEGRRRGGRGKGSRAA